MGLGSGCKTWLAAMLVLALAATVGCGSDGNGDPGDAGFDSHIPTDADQPDGDPQPDGDAPGDGDTPTGDAEADAGDDSPFCVGLNGECATTAECCSGRLCDDDGTGTRRCIDETFCKGTGTACERASECCSLSCDGTCQGDGSICSPVGTDCESDVECCSNDCDGTCQAIGEHCSPMGETCDEEGYDEGCCSKACRNFGTEEDPDLRCIRASSCGARGEICSEPADCCSGVCIDGRCPTQNEIGQKNFAGEPCQVDGDCASYLCASDYPGGPRVCQFLGGCRPTGEICTEDWQCCSDIHMASGALCDSPTDGQGCVPHGNVDDLSTCAGQLWQGGPGEPGELCGDSSFDEVHECCFDCEQTILGVWRCSGGGYACPEQDGGVPEDAGDCPTCVPDGEACRQSADCCSNICSPFLVDDTCDPTITECEIELRCGQCVPTGGLCTSHADCCDFICTDGVCGERDDDDPVCIPVGAPCAEGDVCCDQDAICQDVCRIIG
jgi:hypothetical protein